MAAPPDLRGDDVTATGVEAAPRESIGRSSSQGVDHDDRLILWMLGLAPLKRLEALQNFVDGIATLRHARKITQ